MRISFDEESASFLVDLEGDGHRASGVAVPLQAVASWSELLGYDDIADTLDAILKTWVEKGGEPPPGKDGVSVWTAPFSMLEIRETAREEEAQRAKVEGKQNDPRSPLLRASLAAFHALPRDKDGVCMLDRSRRDARAEMGLPEPERPPSVVRRTTITQASMARNEVKIVAPTCDDNPHTVCDDSERFLCPEDRKICAETLREHALEIAHRQQRYLHARAPFNEDQLAEYVGVEMVKFEPPIEESPENVALGKYGLGESSTRRALEDVVGEVESQ